MPTPGDDVDALFAKSLAALEAREQESDVIQLEGKRRERGSRQGRGATATSSRTKAKTATMAETSSPATTAARERAELPADGGDARGSGGKGRRAGDKHASQTKTAGGAWFDMPAFAGESGKWSATRGPTGEELRREVQAIRLRNSLDPKRFYRGSGDKGMPKFAQLGRIISSTSQPAATMGRSERGRTVVDELVRDAEASAYAKRKFDEEQSRRGAAWSSHVKRHSGKKRERR